MVMALTDARATLTETPLAAWVLWGKGRLYGPAEKGFTPSQDLSRLVST
jgi:hypothetical protein